ncbi:MAG: M23 family metallopeptidase [Clostridia bacterium]
MRTKLARDAAISFLIFAAVLVISRSNLLVASGVRSCIEAVLTRSTSFAELGGTLRDATRSLLSWNPWPQRPASTGNAAARDGQDGGRSGKLPGGGPGGTPGMLDPSQPVALSVARLPEDGGAEDASAVPSEGAVPNQPELLANRGPSVTRALPPSVTRTVHQAQPAGGAQSGDGVAAPSRESAATPEAAGKQGLGASPRAASSSLTPANSSRDSGTLEAPVSGRVTYGFGYRIHPIYKRRLFHEGIDIVAPAGAPVRAAASGRVIHAGPCGTYGNLVELDHGGGLTTLYAHCSRVLVRSGAKVRAGQKIAEVGSTGLSTGPHLHFEVSLNGKPMDPFAYLEGGRRDRL